MSLAHGRIFDTREPQTDVYAFVYQAVGQMTVYGVE
jgi:hypothetical protein